MGRNVERQSWPPQRPAYPIGSYVRKTTQPGKMHEQVSRHAVHVHVEEHLWLGIHAENLLAQWPPASPAGLVGPGGKAYDDVV